MAGSSFLADYEPVAVRIARFWRDHPAGSVRTEIVAAPDGEFVVRAEIRRDSTAAAPDATGHAREVIGEGNVNRSSALENAETSSIGRALAALGYSPKRQRQRTS